MRAFKRFHYDKNNAVGRAQMRKLTSNRGESIGEVLVALLISSLGLMLLALMISTSSRLVSNSKKAMQEYAEGEKIIVERNPPPEGSGIATFSFDGVACDYSDQSTNSTQVYYYVNSAIGNNPVVSYKKKETS